MWRVVAVWALSPVILGVGLFVLTPTYFRPMVDNAFGLAMLLVAGALTITGVVLGMMAFKAIAQRKNRLGVFLFLAQNLFCWLPTILILLLGPAALILMHPRT